MQDESEHQATRSENREVQRVTVWTKELYDRAIEFVPSIFFKKIIIISGLSYVLSPLTHIPSSICLIIVKLISCWTNTSTSSSTSRLVPFILPNLFVLWPK